MPEFVVDRVYDCCKGRRMKMKFMRTWKPGMMTPPITNTKIPVGLLRISRSGTIGGFSLSGSALASQFWVVCLCISRCSQTSSGCGSFSPFFYPSSAFSSHCFPGNPGALPGFTCASGKNRGRSQSTSH